MPVTRSHDKARANYLVNHPEIRPFVGAPEAGEVDLSPVLDLPFHWFLDGEHGGFLLTWSAPRAYEVHTMILPGGRGKWACEAAKAGTEFARQNGVKMLWTRVEPGQRHVALFARIMGMKPDGEPMPTLGKPYAILSMEL
jgi:hypothetical protein